jgi:hypothetical protein
MTTYYSHLTPERIKDRLKSLYAQMDRLYVRVDNMVDALNSDKRAEKKLTPHVNGVKNPEPRSVWDVVWAIDEVMSDAEHNLTNTRRYFAQKLASHNCDFEALKREYVSVEAHYDVHLRELGEVLDSRNKGDQAFIDRAATYFTLRGKKFKQADAIAGTL